MFSLELISKDFIIQGLKGSLIYEEGEHVMLHKIRRQLSPSLITLINSHLKNRDDEAFSVILVTSMQRNFNKTSVKLNTRGFHNMLLVLM